MVRPISGNSKSNLTEITYRVEQSTICDDGNGKWDLGNRNREYPQSQEMTVKSPGPPPPTHP